MNKDWKENFDFKKYKKLRIQKKITFGVQKQKNQQKKIKAQLDKTVVLKSIVAAICL